MKLLPFAFLATAAVARALSPLVPSGLLLETGASYFDLRHGKLESSPAPLSVDEPGRLAPFVAATFPINHRFGVRMSYQFVDNSRIIAEFGSPPGSMLPIVVFGHYHDDVHIVSVAPELRWHPTPRLEAALAPQLNWVASRGVVSYSSTSPLILLVAPRERHEDGFTLGGSVRATWELNSRAGLSVAYQYLDLDPSFDRKAHAVSAGLRWRF